MRQNKEVRVKHKLKLKGVAHPCNLMENASQFVEKH